MVQVIRHEGLKKNVNRRASILKEGNELEGVLIEGSTRNEFYLLIDDEKFQTSRVKQGDTIILYGLGKDGMIVYQVNF